MNGQRAREEIYDGPTAVVAYNAEKRISQLRNEQLTTVGNVAKRY